MMDVMVNINKERAAIGLPPHKHQLKFEKAGSHFLFWKCTSCGHQYLSARETYLRRFKGYWK